MAQKNMSLTKCPMPSLAPDYRNKVFERRHHYCNLQAMADAEEAAQKKEEK